MNVIFKSKNQADVCQSAEHRVWQNTESPKDIAAGSSIVIVPTKRHAEEIGLDPDDRLVVRAIVAEIGPPDPGRAWPSGAGYGSNTYFLGDVAVMPFRNLPGDLQEQISTLRQGSFRYF